MERLNLLYKASGLSYIRFGSGEKAVICFHGYGEDASSFSFFEKNVGNDYSFFAIDLPFHGKTVWKEGYNCTTEDLLQIIEGILTGNNFKLVNGKRQLSLMGFSLGGRIALAVYEKMAPQIERLILLAPDGLKVNFWYWLSTRTWAGNRLFSFTMKYPGWFFGFLKMLNKLKLVNASIFKFVNYYIGDKEARELLYARWTSLRKISPNLRSIKSSVRNNKTDVRLIYGLHDRIILSSVGEKFKQGIEEYCILSVIHSGHQVLNEKHLQELLSSIRF